MQIYEPADDSFLLSDCVSNFIKKNNPKKILDVGSGSGIQAQTCIDSGVNAKDIFLIDVNPDAIKLLKKKFLKSKVILSDLFENIPKPKIRRDPNSEDSLIKKNSGFLYDLIIFNPPYLPEDENEPQDSRTATTGGKKGSEVINKFLIQAKIYLDKDGKILLLTSNLTKGIKWGNWKKKLLRKKKLFFEELRVWELRI